MDVRGTVEKTADDLKAGAEPVIRAAADARVRRHVRASAGHAIAAGRRINGHKRRNGLTGAVADRRTQRHLRESARELGKARSRLRHRRSSRLKGAVIAIGAGLGAYAIVPRILRRFSDTAPGHGDGSYTAGAGGNGARPADLTGGDRVGTMGAATAEADREATPDFTD
jgi:hypothetical protein